MKCFYLIAFCLILTSVLALSQETREGVESEALVCSANEQINDCGVPDELVCGQKPQKHRGLQICKENEPVCECKLGFCRDPATTKCIPELPPQPSCGPNEQVNSCGVACDRVCGKQPPFCILACFPDRPVCECKPGFCRDGTTGECVQDPGENLQCPPNEEPDLCGVGCDQVCGKEPILCPAICYNYTVCKCKPGFCRDETTGECIEEPKKDPVCGDNEQINYCGVACDQKCGQPKIFCNVKCTNIPVCECKPGYCRDELTNQCLPNDIECSPTEQINDCGIACDTICGEGPRECPDICLVDQQACECKPGYCRDKDTNQCVKEPDLKCDCNEQVNHCGHACDQICGEPPISCKFPCIDKQVCECKPNYCRDPGSNKCIPKECALNETFNECGDQCEKQCGQDPPVCPDDCPGPAACVCRHNYCRSPVDGRCYSMAVEECSRREEFNECGNQCEPQCGLDPPPCSKNCTGPPACVCSDKYCRGEDGKCHHKPKLECGKREELNECGNQCELQCGQEPLPCPKNCPGPEACVCREKYCRGQDGKCHHIRKDVCGRNETINYCGDHCEQVCGQDPPKCTKDCPGPPACVCKENYCLNPENGKCYSFDPEDLQCGDNEQVNTCGVACDQQCGKPRRLCKIKCNYIPTCECKPGYCRDEITGKCCPIECHGNETLNECGDHCEQVCGQDPRPCTKDCPGPPACVCQEHFCRNPENGNCLPLAPDVCNSREELNECGNHCEQICGQDPPVCDEDCPGPAACVCKKEYCRSEQDGKCHRLSKKDKDSGDED